MNTINIESLSKDIESELRDNILKFWIDNSVDRENGGFYGFISNDLKTDLKHYKASVLNFRILWTYSAAYRYYKDQMYLFMAERAYDYIIRNFIDDEYSGVYWTVNYKGEPLDSKKQTYSIAFAIYGLSEFYRATGRKESLDYAIKLYNALEEHAYDYINKGYIEACSRDWSPIKDMSLSVKDMNAEKSMNTHLHVMEAYTNLYRVWKDKGLERKLEELINITVNHIINPLTFQFQLFFDKNWRPLSKNVSYGHDIEGSWLLYEAAEVLGNDELLNLTQPIAIRMAKKVFSDGIDRRYGGLFYELENGTLEDFKEWWPQAEAVVGFTNAYQLTGEACYLSEAIRFWGFINEHIIDKINGEWYWGTNVDGSRLMSNEKAGPWKCPYHNSRMCFEMLDRLKKIAPSFAL